MRLNAQSPIPLYQQLATRLREGLDTGVYAVGARIPSEHELAAEYGIGRPTVRQATDLLVRQGRLERRRGSGTYVAEPPKAIDVFSLAGTSAALSASEFETRLEVVRGPVLIAADSARIVVERRAVVNQVPVFYERFLFDADLFAGLEQRNLAGCSISALIQDEFYLVPSSARQTFRVVQAKKTDSERLAVATGSPLLQVTRELEFGTHGTALVVEILCCTDQYEFTQNLYPAEVSSEASNKFTSQVNGPLAFH